VSKNLWEDSHGLHKITTTEFVLKEWSKLRKEWFQSHR